MPGIGRVRRDGFLTDKELAAFMEAVRSRRHLHQPRDHAFFALLANTGIRPSEATALTKGDVHPHARPPWIRIVRLKKKKTVKETDDLQIPQGLAGILAAYVDGLEPDARLFRFTRRQGARLFHYYAKVAGIRRGWLYVLRHTAATRIYRATRDIAVVQAILGHETPDTSTIYAHVTRSMLRQLANAFPAIV